MINKKLHWLQNWFDRNKKSEFLSIETVDNPGWVLSLSIEKSKYKNKIFDDVIIDRTDDNWMHCVKKKDIFLAAGGFFNLNEIIHAFRKWIEDTEETIIIEDEIINWLENWYYQYCDGDWEHSPRIRMLSKSYSSWFFSLFLEDTHCENKTFAPIQSHKSDSDWYKCYVKDGFFEGEGGAFNLIDILYVFRDWAEKCQKE